MQSPDLTFVQLKIAEIRTAVFFCSNNTILPLPAYIVNAIKTNENHLIWFFISTDWNNKVFRHGLFPGKLEFYKKGYPFTLKIEGLAKLIHNKTDMQDLMTVPLMEEVYNGMLLVSVKIQRVKYKELISIATFNPIRMAISRMKKMLHTLYRRKTGPVKWQPSFKIQ